MQTCPHGNRVRREGDNDRGHWVGFFCPLKKGDPEQCKPTFEKSAKEPVKKFEQSLDSSSFQQDQSKKDVLITRTAVVKSMIERGAVYSLESVQEAERWIRFIEGKVPPVTSPPTTQVSPVPIKLNNAADVQPVPYYYGNPTQEIKVEDIPF